MESGSKNIFIYFILLLALFILLFFTKEQFENYQISKANIEKLEKEDKKLAGIIEELNNNKKSLLSNNGETKIGKKVINEKLLNKYIVNFTENNFVEYFYSIGEQFEIEKLEINKGKLDKNGFIKGNIKVSIKFNSEDDMKSFLSKLVDENSKYKFYIEDFKFPIGKMNNGKSTKIDISMNIYYKEKTI